MASDDLRKARKKAKFVVEIRFEPMPEAFDHRGAVLRKLHTHFKNKMKHWSGQNVAVRVADDLEKPTRQVIVEHSRCAVSYEDPGSLSEFVDDAEHALRLVKEIYGEAIPEVHRLGVRFVSIFEPGEARTYEESLNAVRRLYLAPALPTTIKPNDFNVTLRHEAGQLIVGPVQKGEPWVNQM